MESERIKILKMLENKQITAEEASRLLAALQNKETMESSFYNSNNNSNNNSSDSKKATSSIDFSDIKNKVAGFATSVYKKSVKVLNNLEQDIRNTLKNTSNNNKTYNNSQDILKEFNYTITYNQNIRLAALNGEMQIKGYNGDKLTLRVKYTPLIANSNIEFNNYDNNNYVLNFKKECFKKISVEALVPNKNLDKLELDNIGSNCSVDGVKFESLSIISQNSNAIIENCTAKNIKLENNNKGKFILRNITADALNINNIDGFVKLKNLDIQNVTVDNINGEIEAINDYFNKYEDYKWKLETQNSNINVEINTDNVNYDIKAQTTLGSIELNKRNLSFAERSQYSVLASTENKNSSYKNMDIHLTTTNSKILLS